MVAAFLIGRLIFGGFFFANGLNLLMSLGMSIHFAAAKGVPLPEVAVPIAGLLILFGGASILLGWQPELGITAIVLFLVPVTFFMHNFWAVTGAERMAEIANFTKNIALLGATLMYTAIPRPWIYALEAGSPIRA
jgi:putative oxidoreductase